MTAATPVAVVSATGAPTVSRYVQPFCAPAVQIVAPVGAGAWLRSAAAAV
jgi:hypothetical protein